MIDNTKPNPLIELLINLVIPSLILMNLSDPEDLGPAKALLLALAFPLFWGTRDLMRRRKINVFAALGMINVILTGGIGLLQLDTQWLAVKEAAIPGLIGIAVAISAYTPYPLVRVLLYTPALMKVELIQTSLEERGNTAAFESRLRIATWMLACSFFFSSVMNYILAVWIVTSPSGTPAFNEELGRLTLLSYPMIALPATVLMMAVLYYLVRSIRALAGLSFTDVLNQ
ncbi:MAG: MFS transporter [Gammaproteobacteria bacterium]|nr:MFS transporter [Rhodocyclaceae bacterium]MBU3908427.1 MFS transporter [Gammaproteobacteria bacterium]MBU3989351.1 MFS transporter [Gammaproteobacteria bacterium]MBU4005373.1 MFS transporter [Gammaproteobacteria bacterium]MBU4021058.1 MFS transporter [Gammaproteobacteria bacterium]